MTKAELIAALAPYPEDTPIYNIAQDEYGEISGVGMIDPTGRYQLLDYKGQPIPRNAVQIL